MAKPVSDEDKAQAAARKEQELVKYWSGQIEKARRREKKWRKEARELIDIYEGELPEEIPYNILFSNTETLLPALYSAAPRPDTRPRLAQESATAMAAAGLVDAYLENFIDNGARDYCSFDVAIRMSVQGALVPGRGVQRFFYNSEIEKDEKGPRRISWECVNVEDTAWDKVLFGDSRTWESLPWLAFEHVLTEDEAVEMFGAEAAAKLTYTVPDGEEDRSERESKRVKSEDLERVATVHEIWHKKRREILWLELNGKAFVQPAEKDPLGLVGFYPMQEPLQFIRRLSSRMPVPLYRLYKNQAMELNKITRRIDKVAEQIKIRGFYDATIEEIKDVLEAKDGEMIPIRNLASMGQQASADRSVWMVPVEKHVVVLQQLLQDRQAVKQVIFEIMGIADIMRGASVASETLGAQKIKNSWGTLRLKTAQADVARYIRDGLRIAAEIAFSKLSPETLRKVTGSTLPSAKQLEEAEGALLQAKEAGQPAPPELLAQMALPSFEECLEALQDDFTRNYLIDIETNSSIDADAVEDKQNVAEFMTAFSQLLNGLAPLIEKGAMPFAAAKALMLNVAKKFNMGKQVYRELAQMQAPQAAAGPDPKVTAELEKAQEQVRKDSERVKDEKTRLELDKLRLEKDKEIFAIQKQAAEAISRAQESAAQATRTAAGAVKASEAKAKSVQDQASMGKVITQLQGLLEKVQEAAQRGQQEMEQKRQLDDATRAQADAERAAKQSSDLSALVKEVKEAIAAAGKLQRRAVKQKDGSWKTETVKDD